MEKFGSREICNVVFKAKTAHSLGSLTVEAGEPVLYFDSLKTSSIETSATAVYARGGRGNPKLITWEGEKEMTFIFEDALLSKEGMAILAGAELAAGTHAHHVAGRVMVEGTTEKTADLSAVIEEALPGKTGLSVDADEAMFVYKIAADGARTKLAKTTDYTVAGSVITVLSADAKAGDVLLVDFYVTATSTTINITPDKFGGTYYIEADTLFRTEDGVDHAAQLVFPKGKIQTAFNLAMANSGDPSTFTFTVDVMPDYVLGDKTKKRLVAISIVD
ncbi:MAG: hypothetical protein ACRDCN_12860 [Tannerellaceae bacterium]